MSWEVLVITIGVRMRAADVANAAREPFLGGCIDSRLLNYGHLLVRCYGLESLISGNLENVLD